MLQQLRSEWGNGRKSGKRNVARRWRLLTPGEMMTDAQGPLERIEGRLEDQGHTLSEHSRILHEHGGLLREHGRILREHGGLLRVLVGQSGEIRDLKEFVKKIVDEHERRIQALEKPGGDTLRPT